MGEGKGELNYSSARPFPLTVQLYTGIGKRSTGLRPCHSMSSKLFIHLHSMQIKKHIFLNNFALHLSVSDIDYFGILSWRRRICLQLRQEKLLEVYSSSGYW